MMSHSLRGMGLVGMVQGREGGGGGGGGGGGAGGGLDLPVRSSATW